MREGSTARDGNQTLARGLRVFLAIVDAERGLSVQQVGDLLGVHRSIAYRLLQTLVEYSLVTRSKDGVYLPGRRLPELAAAYLPDVRSAAAPVMRALADQLQSTVSLFAEQGGEAVAITMVEPTTATHHIAFQPGMRTPMDRGAAAYAMLTLDEPSPDEQAEVTEARERGFAFSHGEVERDAFGVAAAIATPDGGVRVCVNLITYRSDIADAAGGDLRKAAARIARRLRARRPEADVAEGRGVAAAIDVRGVTGSQTLGRGLSAFLAVVESTRGLTVQQVSELLDVHRTIAYRLLQTLLDFGLVTRNASAAYVAGARLATLAEAYVPRLQDVALPVMQRLADELESTVLLFIEQNGEAVAISECEPTTGTHHIAFRSGMRTPLDRGAAAFALRAGKAPKRGEPEGVARARVDGFARSTGAVLPGAHGVAAPIPLPQGSPPACIMVVTYLESVADGASGALRAAAERIAEALDPG